MLRDGSLAAHWLVKSSKATYAYDVNIARSDNGGKTWTQPIVPHRDNTQTEHGFVSLIPLSDGRVGAVWLDGRNMKDMKESDEHAPAPASMTLRYAAIDRKGNLSDEAELDNRVCECCQTSAAVTSDGQSLFTAIVLSPKFVISTLSGRSTAVGPLLRPYMQTTGKSMDVR